MNLCFKRPSGEFAENFFSPLLQTGSFVGKSKKDLLNVQSKMFSINYYESFEKI